jgi:hypothetical protein
MGLADIGAINLPGHEFGHLDRRSGENGILAWLFVSLRKKESWLTTMATVAQVKWSQTAIELGHLSRAGEPCW